MNRDQIVNEMIAYIEEEERNLQAEKFSNESRTAKTDIVDGILKELEKRVNDEN